MNKIRLQHNLYFINLSSLNDVATAVVNEEQQGDHKNHTASGNDRRQQRCENGCYAFVMNGTDERRRVSGPRLVCSAAVAVGRVSSLCGGQTAALTHATTTVINAVKIEAAVREAALCALTVRVCSSKAWQ